MKRYFYSKLDQWKSKFKNLSDREFEVALKTTENVSKHHPSNFQLKVISSLNLKIDEVEQKFNIKLSKEHV